MGAGGRGGISVPDQFGPETAWRWRRDGTRERAGTVEEGFDGEVGLREDLEGNEGDEAGFGSIIDVDMIQGVGHHASEAKFDPYETKSEPTIKFPTLQDHKARNKHTVAGIAMRVIG